MIASIYIVILSIQEFITMFQRVDIEEVISELYRIFMGELYYYEEFLFSIVYILFFGGALLNLVSVVYSERILFNSLSVLYKYRGIL